jgi:hypothetical protein
MAGVFDTAPPPPTNATAVSNILNVDNVFEGSYELDEINQHFQR